MSTLSIEVLTMPAADLGPENPLPPLKSGLDLHRIEDPIPGVPDEMLQNMVYGRIANILPYTMQDGYDRHRELSSFRVAILENEILRATFLLELGGRLWSLVHKPSGRELLDVNPVFQPANLALRNAWFSGGVEWNIGTIGHSPFTCSPLFAAEVHTPDSTPVLRLYEWERIRQVPFQIDAYLPDGSPVLFIRVQITNPHRMTVPMYWWSNIAVPETPETRVLIPADSAYSFGYGGGELARVPIPEVGDVDITYPTRIKRSADFFFDIPGDERPWITALDETGRGLFQASTARLKGRKLFLWGTGEGGRRWQTFLAEPGHAYIEIQAGLARTQLEHLPMPALSRWTWLEAYGLMEADPAAVHGADWSQAVGAVRARVDELIPATTLDRELAKTAAWADQPPETLIQRGSGWGALERLRREEAGESLFCTASLVFDDASLGAPQAPWRSLLTSGRMPSPDPLGAPAGYMTQSAWRERLERSVLTDSENWFAWMHLGVMRYAAVERQGAKEAWQASVAAAPNPWAYRNLGLMAWEDGAFDDAKTFYLQALAMLPSLLPLAIEVGQKLIAMGHAQAWLDIVEELPAPIRASGRIRLLEGQAALDVGDLERVAPLFDGTLVVNDLREGERSLSQLWYAYHEKRVSREEGCTLDEELKARVRRDYPVPPSLDFRMSST